MAEPVDTKSNIQLIGTTESDGEDFKNVCIPRSSCITLNGVRTLKFFPRISRQIYEMVLTGDEVFLCSLPGPATKWLQEVLWCLVNNVKQEDVGPSPLESRFPLLERSALGDYEGRMDLPEYFRDSVGYILRLPPTRLINTHLPLILLPQQMLQKAKIVYIAQNPRDMCVWYYHRHIKVESHEDDFQSYCERFLQGETNLTPYWDHVLPFWHERNRPNVLFLQYEEMKKDERATVEKIAHFLGKSLSEDTLVSAREHLWYRCIDYNPLQSAADNLRCGRSPGWKEVMSSFITRRFEQWEQYHMQGTAYEIDYLGS